MAARFVAPSGKSTEVRGFATPTGSEVRFLPREAGTWRYLFAAGDGANAQEGSFQVAPGTPPTMVTVDPRDPHSFALSDGTRFHPLGENRFNVYDTHWNWNELSSAAYIERMARAGMNTLRIFIFTDCEREEPLPSGPQPGCLEPKFGEFDEAAAERYDAIFEAAEKHGVRVILTLYAVGFTPEETWKSWEDNPYNEANGGPAKSPEDFFENGESIRGAEKRLRYVLARWGASPAFFGIDLLNEPEWDGEIGEATWLPWAEHLARIWHAEDPYGHPVTVGSVGLHWNIEGDEHAWYGHEQNDFVQWHLYGKEIYDSHDLAKEMTRKIRETWRHGKPTLIGEFGYGGEDRSTFDHTHVGIWTATFAGAGALSHSAPPFTLDSDTPMTDERAEHFRVLSGFLARFDPKTPLTPLEDRPAAPQGSHAWVMKSGGDRALWVMGPKKGYGTPVEGARVVLQDVAPGAYQIEWFDDVTGAALQTQAATVGENRELLAAPPPFTRHVAARVSPAQG